VLQFFKIFQIKFSIYTGSYNFDFSQADKTTQKELITSQCDLVLERNLFAVELHVTCFYTHSPAHQLRKII